MTTYRAQLVQQGADAALGLRRSAGIALSDAVCVYDFAEKLGIEVRFLDIPSLEEMYCRKSKPAIIISSLRPAGRRAFNCAHGLGHHVFKHGTRVDEIVCQSSIANGFDPEEFLADCFAGFFLMTRVAVSHAFALRGLTPEKSIPTDIYLIANWFGVGYSTLINHMSLTLKLISQGKANELLKVSPKQIRSTLLDEGIENDVIPVDHHWRARAIDCQVGDFIMLPSHTYLEGSVATYVREIKNGSLFRATEPGIGQFLNSESPWASYVRIARASYVGRSIFRFERESEDD